MYSYNGVRKNIDAEKNTNPLHIFFTKIALKFGINGGDI